MTSGRTPTLLRCAIPGLADDCSWRALILRFRPFCVHSLPPPVNGLRDLVTYSGIYVAYLRSLVQLPLWWCCDALIEFFGGTHRFEAASKLEAEVAVYSLLDQDENPSIPFAEMWDVPPGSEHAGKRMQFSVGLLPWSSEYTAAPAGLGPPRRSAHASDEHDKYSVSSSAACDDASRASSTPPQEVDDDDFVTRGSGVTSCLEFNDMSSPDSAVVGEVDEVLSVASDAPTPHDQLSRAPGSKLFGCDSSVSIGTTSLRIGSASTRGTGSPIKYSVSGFSPKAMRASSKLSPPSRSGAPRAFRFLGLAPAPGASGLADEQ